MENLLTKRVLKGRCCFAAFQASVDWSFISVAKILLIPPLRRGWGEGGIYLLYKVIYYHTTFSSLTVTPGVIEPYPENQQIFD